MTIPQILPATPSLNWTYKQIKYIGVIRYGVGEPPVEKDDGVLFVRATNIHAGKVYGAGMLRVDPAQVPWHRNVSLALNDIIVVRSGAYTGDSAIIAPEYEGAVVGFDLVLRCHSAHPSFVQYALLSEYLLDAQIKLRKLRAAQPHINAEDLGECVIILPDCSVQKAVATFLDNETSRIDTLISKKERQIELLQEKRQAIITRAVTKGLNSSVRMKDSGVEWIGNIPNHWSVVSIKHLSLVKRGASPRPIDDPKYFDDEGEYSWVRISDVSASDKYLLATEQRLSPLGKSLSVPLQPNSLFLSIAGSVGKPIITKIKCCIHDGFVYFPYYQRDHEFLYYIFLSGEPFGGLGKLGTQLNLNTDTVGSIKIPLPSLGEQKSIVNYLNAQSEHQSHVLNKLRRSVDLLQEYRSSLITAAVSGQIDVSNMKTKAPE